MIPGTHKETAKLALAAMGMRNNIAGLYAYRDAERDLSLAERRELRARYQLPRSSAMPYAVALAVNLVKVEPEEGEPSDDTTQIYTGAWLPRIRRAVADALSATATGGNELWFDAEGNAFLSFEHEEDATLFRLALDA